MATQPPHIMRETLLEQMESLSPPELSALQVLAIAAEPLTHNALLDICRNAGLPLKKTPDATPVPTLLPQVQRLKSLHLIDDHSLVNEVILEVIARRVFADKQSRVVPILPAEKAQKKLAGRWVPKSQKPKPRPLPVPVPLAKAIVDAVRAALPAPSSFFHLTGLRLVSACNRTLRELRIALLDGNSQQLEHCTRILLNDCTAQTGSIDPLVRLLNNPFDAAWFGTLSPIMQTRLLSRIFNHTFFNLEPDGEALELALVPALRGAVPADDRLRFTFDLIIRLLLGGEPAQARQLLDEIERQATNAYTFGFTGWIALIEGRLEDSLNLFTADLKEFRRQQRKRTLFFSNLAAPFFILALLRKGDADSLKQAGTYLDQLRRRYEYSTFMAAILAALTAMLASQNGFSPEEARAPLVALGNDWKKIDGGLGLLFVGMASFSLSGQLSRKEIKVLDSSFIRAREANLNWLAMEYAELLCRADREIPDRREFIRTTCAATGLVSLTAGIVIEEPWRKSLRALRVAVSGAVTKDKNSDEAPQSRIVYLLRFSRTGALEDISPLEQKLTAKGAWTKGRPIALQRLVSGDRLEGLTKADQPLRSAIHRSEYYYGNQYEFNLKRALPALVGHPFLFLADSPTTPVEMLKGEPEIMVLRQGKEVVISLIPKVTNDEPFVLVRETPTRYRVIELSEAHHRLARILGGKGLALPATAQEEIAPVLAEVASLVTVHSTIPGTAHSIESVAADSTPRVHLLPHGQGLSLEILVRPFKDDGPYLKPGQGTKNLMADVSGRRCQTERNLQEEKTRTATLEQNLPALAALPDMDGQWFSETPEDALQVLVELQEARERGETVVEWPEGEKLKVGKTVSFANLKLHIRSTANWFEMEGELRVDEERVLDLKEMLDLLQTTPHRFLPLGDGQFVALSRELRKRLDELAAYTDKRGKKVGVHPLAALALEDLTEQVGGLDADAQWYARLERIRDGLAVTPALPSTLKAQLRDYQMEGYQWLARLAHLGFGACLADDMGLGKTVQTLAVILHNAPQGPTLVVAPTSVCANWMNEAQRFAPTLKIHPFGGSNREALVADLGPMDVLVSSYGLLHQESEMLAAVDWQTIVLDEAQAIKNAGTKRSQAAMGLKGQFKIVTTGTPIENHLGEFWTLFHFINPGLLGSRERFNTRFAAPIERYNDRETRRRLKKLVQPFILRRLKSQVLEELPPRTEVVLQVELSKEETAFYEALRQKALERIDAEQGPAAQKPMQILAEITRLRRACCHPRLILPETPLVGSKLTLFGEVVAELLENGHKALVFSQFVGHLALIREYLDGRNIPYRYLDGSTPAKERQREVEAFQAGQGDLFLISLKAGGLGLNLTAADYVIHMDPWWNPAVEDQASDRAHRIGQERPVTVYRLVAQNTIEEKIVRMHAEKRDLADSLLDETDASAKISADELLRLIREP